MWVRVAAGSNADSHIAPGAAVKMPFDLGVPIHAVEGSEVLIGYDRQGNGVILGNSKEYWQRAGVNLHTFNQADPSNKYLPIEYLTNANSFPAGGNMSVLVMPFIYRKLDEFVYFEGTTVDLTSDIPAGTEDSVVVCLWLDMDTNTVTTTNSSEFDQGENIRQNRLIALTYINEAAATMPVNSLGIWSYEVRGTDTVLDQYSKLHDLRGIIGTGGSGGNVQRITSTGSIEGTATLVASVIFDGSTTINGSLTIL
jgi:hypothetical protein